MQLEFDELYHVYKLVGDGGERKLPSVSQVLQKSDMYGYPRTPQSRERMAFGSHIHSLSEMHDNLVLNVGDLGWPEKEYISAYEKFKEDVGLEILVSEKAIYHPLYLYGAKPDRIAITKKIDNLVRVLEIKTGQPHPANFIQLSAYHEAYNSTPENDFPATGPAMAVYLSKDGSYRLVTNNDHEKNWAIFLSCLQIYRWKEKHGIGK